MSAAPVPAPHCLRVALGARSYPILVGAGLVAGAGQHIRPLLAHPSVIVLTDRRVAALHGPALARALDGAGIAHELIALPPGEETKDFAQLGPLLEQVLSLGIERSSMLVAFGGGVIGDLAGFAASILLRGIDFIQIPTTLLAQVDSSVGGKTGVNARQGKNLIGSFHQPRLVLADTDMLASLPRRELLAGYAEIVKYGLIGDPAFFSWLEGHGRAIVEGEASAQRQAVMTSCRIKARVVEADEREAGPRALLNLGHTFGHALEAECGFSDEMLHGEAVALGMILAFDLSVLLGVCPAEDADRVRRHLAAVGLPTGLDRFAGRVWDPGRLIAHMRKDKKVAGGKLAFILARGIGEAFLSREVPEEALVELLAEAAAPALASG